GVQTCALPILAMCDLLASARRCAFRVGGDRRDIMPPAMGQPITVVERPTRTPGLARFELNRSLTGQGHEHYRSLDDVLDDRPVDRLARRLFETDRKSTRLNSSHVKISYAVFCLKKKIKNHPAEPKQSDVAR